MPDTSADPLASLSPAYVPAFVFGLSVQAALLFTTASILDTGQTFREFAAAVLCQSLATVLLVCRRPAAPLRSDLAFIRFGVLACWLAFILAAPLAAWVRGRGLPGGSRTVAGYYSDRVLGACMTVFVGAVPWLVLWGAGLAVGKLTRLRGSDAELPAAPTHPQASRGSEPPGGPGR